MITLNLQMPEKLEMEDQSYSNTYGKFFLQPLEKGFGVTLGNALRRVLLSSLTGTAFTGISIKGVLHEFSTIAGVKEDVAELILNLKTIRMKLINKKAAKVTLSVEGPKKITASDIQKANPEIEILNLSQHIATIEDGVTFEAELYLGRGKGFVPADENKYNEQHLGVIPIDAIFSPIINVRYTIEPTRVGQQTDYEKLLLEIQTDGSITPDEALTQAAKILRDHIQLFINFEYEPFGGSDTKESESEIARIREILKTPVDELELSVRSHNVLRSGNISTLGDLVRIEISDLLKFRNFGRKSLSELTEIAEKFGLTFGMDVDKYLKNNIG
ncbi:MAG: DNA-directed RNA polymerase subunit alpha [Bacteroidetes bacterium]|nr:DNA-directed RNA polymerase subunit alpha [Bacteroidota bacterium]MBU1422254.1 DNA-directed RNA polymerase subunit alpha [Bacteroidota bacterium]MBU2471460.1 DNA-directed RNA polymerase subunit alpha [Bacteroidota bacterium]MBU2636004.1 DNA-directed RNA polymerase subunit alpha [Bacteroidota bacterium]